MFAIVLMHSAVNVFLTIVSRAKNNNYWFCRAMQRACVCVCVCEYMKIFYMRYVR